MSSVLAFDFGEKRIGVAVADATVGIAHPLSVIAAEDNSARFAAIASLVEEWKPAQFVVGTPQPAEDSGHEIARLARRFARRIEGRFNIPVDLVDETLSSHAAEQQLREQGLRGEKLSAALDSAAACEILRTWLNDVRHRARNHAKETPPQKA